MGASDWDYSVPYREDVAAALEQLRADVYARGEYYEERPDPSLQLTEEEFVAALHLDDDPDGIKRSQLEWWREAKARPAPVDADTLLAAQPDSGTHSIIDICDGLSEQREVCKAAPLSAEQILDFFGTERPTTEQVREWIDSFDVARIRSRWEGAYVLSYSPAGEPEQIHFAGFSGD
jgi:hypothetical protein